MSPAVDSAAHGRLVREGEYRWVLPARGSMRVPGIVFASEALLPGAIEDQSLSQVENVATLPGVVRASYAMPDIHWGYGFPIGGVAATDVGVGGVVSPGGVGFDISCGVRLLVGEVTCKSLLGRERALMRELARQIPAGQGSGAIWPLGSRQELERVLREGARAAVEAGLGTELDLEVCEDRGVLPVSDISAVSARAVERGLGQLGSLGSGNHFLEVQWVDQVFDEGAAAAFGLRIGCVAVMIHSGSRGLGHQVCSDHVAEMVRQLSRYGITLPDRQLACAPVDSPHGRRYLEAMAAAANYGRANRQAMTAAVRAVFRSLDAGDLRLVYDVSHNLAKREEHPVDGDRRQLCVHRKGATRALPPGHPELPTAYREHGQPVLVPGSMGTASYVLVGEPEGQAFFSTCHGAGRVMSRKRAMKGISGQELERQLAERGITVAARSLKYLPEEQPDAYKDVSEVVRVCEGAGLSRPVARLKPFGVLKG